MPTRSSLLGSCSCFVADVCLFASALCPYIISIADLTGNSLSPLDLYRPLCESPWPRHGEGIGVDSEGGGEASQGPHPIASLRLTPTPGSCGCVTAGASDRADAVHLGAPGLPRGRVEHEGVPCPVRLMLWNWSPQTKSLMSKQA